MSGLWVKRAAVGLRTRLGRGMSTGAASGVPAVPATYSTLMQANHLLGGAAVLGCVGTVLQAQKYKPGKDKGDLMFLHKSFGLLSFLLLGPRLAARALQTLPSAPPSVGIPLEKALAAVTHYGLYGGLLLMPATGIVMGAYGGRGLPFFTTTSSRFAVSVPAVSPDVEEGDPKAGAVKMDRLYRSQVDPTAMCCAVCCVLCAV